MANTSATGGYLAPTTPDPLYDDALDDLFQGVVAALSGLPGKNVRPRFQTTPPKQLGADVDWCAVGVMTIDRDANPVTTHRPDGLGADDLVRHEEIHVLASFYGPHAGAIAARTADGLALVQNNDVLQSQLMLYVNNDTIRQVPELVNEQWIRRLDLPIRFRRQVKRSFEVNSFAAADSVIVRG